MSDGNRIAIGGADRLRPHLESCATCSGLHDRAMRFAERYPEDGADVYLSLAAREMCQVGRSLLLEPAKEPS